MSQTLPIVPGAMPETTTARLVAVDHPVTHDAWVTEWTTREERYELVDGIPLMTPPEHPRNLIATNLLDKRLYAILGEDWYYVPGPAVRIVGDPRPTYRIPDFALLPRGATLDLPLDPAPIVLVVEALSPSTRAEDPGRKRLDYASVGIPNYLLIDRERTPRLTLLTRPRGRRLPGRTGRRDRHPARRQPRHRDQRGRPHSLTEHWSPEHRPRMTGDAWRPQRPSTSASSPEPSTARPRR